MFGKESHGSSTSSNNNKPLFPKKRKRTETDATVETVVASTGFPISNKNAHIKNGKPTTTAVEQQQFISSRKRKDNNKNNTKLLDWHATAKEVRQLGATAFVKQQKRDYQDEEYFRLTGQPRKKQHVPLPIVRGIRKKAAAREAAAYAQAKAAGHVLPPKTTTTAKKNDKNTKNKNRSNHGPAPSIGFVKKGVLQLKQKPV